MAIDQINTKEISTPGHKDILIDRVSLLKDSISHSSNYTNEKIRRTPYSSKKSKY